MRELARIVALGFLVAGNSPWLSAQEQNWVGKRVIVKEWSAELKVGSKTLARARLGEILQVSKMSGEWLWIRSKGGWILRNDVVLYDRAIPHFTAAITRNPTAEAYHRRAVARVAMGNYQKAVADFSEVIKRAPRNMAAYNDRGNALRKLGKLDPAIADFNMVIKAKVRHPAVYVNRGLAWHDKGDDDRALTDYNAAITIDAEFAPAWDAGGTSDRVVDAANGCG